MKLKIILTLFVLSLALVLSGSFVYNQKVLANFLTKKPAEPAIAYEDYSKMERKSDRDVAFRKETPEGKSILWRQHLAYANAQLDLNESQRVFLHKLSEILDANFFVTVDAKKGLSEFEFAKTEDGKSYGELMNQVSALFTEEQIKQLFLTIGDTSTITDFSCGGNASTDVMHKDSDNTENLLPTCSCTGSFCGAGCPANNTCQLGFPGRNCSGGSGCGCGGWFECTAKCVPN